MTDSILDTTKQLLGIPSTDTSFDIEIITHINSVFMTLNQLGVGPDEVFSITDKDDEWSSFSSDISTYSQVKSYIHLKVRIIFDPPGTASLIESMKNLIQEMEWRLMTQVPIPEDPVG